jgi:hypothetical protein
MTATSSTRGGSRIGAGRKPAEAVRSDGFMIGKYRCFRFDVHNVALQEAGKEILYFPHLEWALKFAVRNVGGVKISEDVQALSKELQRIEKVIDRCAELVKGIE